MTYVTCGESHAIDGVDLCKSFLSYYSLHGHLFRAIVDLGLRPGGADPDGLIGVQLHRAHKNIIQGSG